MPLNDVDRIFKNISSSFSWTIFLIGCFSHTSTTISSWNMVCLLQLLNHLVLTIYLSDLVSNVMKPTQMCDILGNERPNVDMASETINTWWCHSFLLRKVKNLIVQILLDTYHFSSSLIIHQFWIIKQLLLSKETLIFPRKNNIGVKDQMNHIFLHIFIKDLLIIFLNSILGYI